MEQSTQNSTKENKKKINKRVILVILFLAIFAIFTYGSVRANYLETLEIGAQYVEKFMQNLEYNMIIAAFNFVIIYLIIYITTVFIKRGLRKFFIEEKLDMPKLPNKSIALIGSAVLTILVVPAITSEIMLSINVGWFGITDKIFNMDIGYYMFQKPCIEMMLQYAIVLLIGLSIYIAAYYIIVINKYFDGVEIESLKKNTFLKQIVLNIILIAISIGILTMFKSQDILFSNFMNLENNVGLVGAGSIDVIFKVWGYRILAVLMVISVILAVRYFKKGNKRKAVISLVMVPAYLVCMFAFIIGYKVLFINTNELEKEKEYIKYNIEATKSAYNINIEEKELENSGTITLEEVNKNQGILNNIPIIDKNTTLLTLKEYQTKVGYYTFNNTKLLNYNNELVYVTPREIISNGAISKTNKTYEYTHGYGTIVSKATATDELGNIQYVQNSFENEANKIKIEEPRIYFGLSTNDTIITNSKSKEEFDYPITNTNIAKNKYDGNAGIQLGFIDRLILSIKEKNINLAFNGDVTKESKILLNRNVIERAKTVLPELVYDQNPYLVVSDEGKLVWVLDAYTISDKYPYSTNTVIDVNGNKTNINYIRNSAKVIIDAYDGTMEFYITDRNDPIIMAYNKIYPSLFMSPDKTIPETVSKYIVYPEYLYNIQSKMLSTYHDIQPEVLYRNDDMWEIAAYSLNTTAKETKMEPYYAMVKDGEDTKQGLVVPYTPSGKRNIISYLVGTYDVQNNGKLVLYKFKTDSNVLGPKQLERQIEEDENISKELKSITLAGTKIIKNLLAIPIENTILYVEPVYQVLLNESQVPILKKIIVASGNKLAIGDTLKEALTNLLSQYATDIEITNTEDIEALVEAIIKANENLTSSSNINDWELMGKDINKLQSLIIQLDKLRKEEAAKEENTSQNQGQGQGENVPVSGNSINISGDIIV